MELRIRTVQDSERCGREVQTVRVTLVRKRPLDVEQVIISPSNDVVVQIMVQLHVLNISNDNDVLISVVFVITVQLQYPYLMFHPPPNHIHTRTHARTHARMHTRTRTHTNTPD